jgi:sulfite reductase (NADPH) flavoprotein alpha-component
MDMTIPPVADAGISDKDRELIRTLARSLKPEQALWVGGYLAGAAEARSELLALADGEASTVISKARETTAPAAVLRILYAGETGNAAALAREVETKAKAAGFTATAEDLARYKTRGLKDEQTLLFIASTHGEGDPPETAAGFFEFLASRKAPSLKGLRYAVLGLGDSTYEFFCEAGKILDRRLEELGASRLLERRDCDVDYQLDAQQWLEQALARLQETAPTASSASGAGRTGLQQAVSPLLIQAAPAASQFGKGNPFQAQVTANIRITGRGSSKDTRHLELSLEGSGLSYLPGDALGIVPRNDPALAEELVGLFGWSGAETVKGRRGETSIGAALLEDYEIMSLTPRFIERWAALSGDARLAELAKGSRSDIAAFMQAKQVIDVVRSSPVPGLSPQDFVQSLRGLQPRLYSIASSAEFAPDEAHICVAPVRFALDGRQRHGVASTFLAEALQPGDSVPVYVQRNDNFRLPANPAAPIIMIGAGTGVAPYRGFMQHREALGITGRSWLVFGERNFRTDFLYQVEWQDWHRSGALARVDLAFSRDQQEKVYVQHKLRSQAAELHRWLEDGAHLYLCGDAEQMAHDVHQALLAVVAGQRNRGPEDAEAYLRGLQADRRYQKDVY